MRRSFTDIHSHVLPGVDDGATDVSQAVSILRQMEGIGINKLILTPHYCKRRGYEKPVKAIREVYEDFCRICCDEGINIELFLGTEMEYSTDAVRYIREERVVTLADSRYILLEFPPYVKSDTISRAAKEILQLGLVPIIAHIERYGCLYKNFETLYMLRDIGVELQVNVRSLCSRRFGVRRFLKRVITEELADYIAGDVHTCPIDEREFDKCCSFVIKNSSSKYLEQLLSGNAQKLFNRR